MNMYFGTLLNSKKGRMGELINKNSSPKILQDWEKLNVDIPSKRKRMRQHFVDIIKEQNKGVLERNNLYQEEEMKPAPEEARRMKT
jgi:hypothetical protein